MLNKKLGELGEGIAAKFLSEKGYAIIERNFRLREGEIDLICRVGKVLIFIEVKTRSGKLFGRPEEAVDQKKLEKLEALSQAYCDFVNHAGTWKIEIVSILVNHQKKSIGIKHLTEL